MLTTVVSSPPEVDQPADAKRRTTAPSPDGELWFRILIGQPGSGLAVTGAIEVGTLRLPSGGMVGVIVHPGPLSPGSAAKVAEIRGQMLAAVTAAGARRNTAFLGPHGRRRRVAHRSRRPIEPEGAEPVGAEQNGAPGTLTYVRRADPASGRPHDYIHRYVNGHGRRERPRTRIEG